MQDPRQKEIQLTAPMGAVAIRSFCSSEEIRQTTFNPQFSSHAQYRSLYTRRQSLEDNADQPVLEPAPGETPLWPRIQVSALFPLATDPAHIDRSLNQPAPLNSRSGLCVTRLDDRDWEREWLRDFGPMQFGRRLWVCPSGQDGPGGDAVVEMSIIAPVKEGDNDITVDKRYATALLTALVPRRRRWLGMTSIEAVSTLKSLLEPAVGGSCEVRLRYRRQDAEALLRFGAD